MVLWQVNELPFACLKHLTELNFKIYAIESDACDEQSQFRSLMLGSSSIVRAVYQKNRSFFFL